jgi:hypothetical protein
MSFFFIFRFVILSFSSLLLFARILVVGKETVQARMLSFPCVFFHTNFLLSYKIFDFFVYCSLLPSLYNTGTTQ